jgi:hypothetical protein
MNKQRASIDDLLTKQMEPLFVATIEAVDGKPDMVKITPWVASEGCSCNLSLQIPKRSLDGVTPTGEIHFCCGKSLQVVELHFKSGEAIGIDDVMDQLQAAAKKAASPSDGGANPMRAPGPPLPTPPPWGWQLPWFTQDHPLRQKFRQTASERYPNALCQSNHERCLEHCFYSFDPDRCRCLCGSSYALCLGHVPFEC